MLSLFPLSGARSKPWICLGFVALIAVLVAIIFAVRQGNGDQELVSTVPSTEEKPEPEPFPRDDNSRRPSSEELLEKSFIEDSGDAHSEALEFIAKCIRERLELTPDDRNALLHFISEPKPAGIASGQWQERVNEILNLLRAQPGEVPGFANLLVRMSSEDPDPVLRMYALQHIAMWIPREPTEDNKVEMLAFLQELAASEENPLAGSAVLFLNDLDQSKELPDRIDATEVIDNAALRLAGDKSARPDVRICALHTSAERKLSGVIGDSRAIAGDDALMIPLRKAAIYTIGEVGTDEDIALLESLSQSNRVLTAATKPAIKRIQSRHKKL